MESNVSKLNLASILAELKMAKVSPDMSNEDAMSCMKLLGKCGQHSVGLVSFDGETAWERHTMGDELLFIISGSVELIASRGGQHERLSAQAGDLVIVPEGLWHSQMTDGPVELLFLTIAEGSERKVDMPT